MTGRNWKQGTNASKREEGRKKKIENHTLNKFIYIYIYKAFCNKKNGEGFCIKKKKMNRNISKKKLKKDQEEKNLLPRVIKI